MAYCGLFTRHCVSVHIMTNGTDTVELTDLDSGYMVSSTLGLYAPVHQSFCDKPVQWVSLTHVFICRDGHQSPNWRLGDCQRTVFAVAFVVLIALFSAY